MANNPVQLPSGFGGIVRYKEEYHSKIRFSPVAVIVFVVIIIAFVLLLKVFIPTG